MPAAYLFNDLHQAAIPMVKLTVLTATALLLTGGALPLPGAAAAPLTSGEDAPGGHSSSLSSSLGVRLLQVDRGDGVTAPALLTPGEKSHGQQVWSGRLKDDPTSTVIEVQQGSKKFLTVASKYGSYQLAPRRGKVLKEQGDPLPEGLARAPRATEAPPAGAPATSAFSPQGAAVAAPPRYQANIFSLPSVLPGGSYAQLPTVASPAVVDVLWAYTPQALTALGSKADVESTALMVAASINAAAKNSKAPFQVRVAGIVPTATGDRATITDNLYALSNKTDGLFADLDRAKQSTGADALQLLSMSSGCGLAFVTSNSAWAYSTFNVKCGTSLGQIGAHEFGHNLGQNHDRYVEGGSSAPGYNYGYINYGQRVKDVMSYDNGCTAQGKECPTLLQFSSPGLTYNGSPMGIPAGKPGAADSVRSITENVATLAAGAAYSGVPTLADTWPHYGDGNISLSSPIYVRFDKAVKGATATSLRVVNKATGAAVPGTTVYTAFNNTLKFTPAASYSSVTRYRVDIAGGLSDATTGKAFPATSFVFSTGPAPVVRAVWPKSGSTGLRTYAMVNIYTNRPTLWTGYSMPYLYDATTGKKVAVTYRRNWDGMRFDLDPVSNLAPYRRYTAVIQPKSFTDSAGNFVAPLTWSFTTST